MTQDEIVALAREAGFVVTHIGDPIGTNYTMIEAFANLVAAKEREACAKVCDELSDKHTWEGCYADECAQAIRARGEQA